MLLYVLACHPPILMDTAYHPPSETANPNQEDFLDSGWLDSGVVVGDSGELDDSVKPVDTSLSVDSGDTSDADAPVDTGDTSAAHVDTADSASLPTDTSDGTDTSGGVDTATDTGLHLETGIMDTADLGVDTALADTGSVCTATTWYADADGDSFGDAGTATSSCAAPTGYVADSSDCDDSDASYWYACTTCERELVDTVGFDQNSVWPGDSSDVEAQLSLDSATSAAYVGVRWSVGMDDYVTCAAVDSSGAVPTATMDLQYAGSYLAFGWLNVAGAISYVDSSDITGATVDSFSYLNYGDVGGNAYLAP